MKGTLHVLFCCIISLSLSLTLFSQSRVDVDKEFESIELTQYLSYSPTPIVELKQLSETTFFNLPPDFQCQETLQDTTWFKFELVNTSNQIKNLTFTIGNIHFENFCLYKETKVGIKTIFRFTKTHGGKRKNFYLKPNESAVYYLKALHKNTNFHFTPKITDTFLYQEKLTTANYVGVSFYGGLIFIFIFSIILSIYFRQMYLLSYALYVLFYGAFLSVYEGYFEYIFFVNNRELSGVLTIAFIFLSYIFNLIFLTSFLKTKHHFPVLYLISRFLIFILSILTLVNFIPFVNDALHNVIMLPTLLCMVFIFVLIIVSSYQKVELAKMVFFSYVWLMSFGVLSLLVDYNIVFLPVGGKLLMKLGLFGELIMLTMAVVIFLFRVNDMLKVRLEIELGKSQKMNNELEQKQLQLEHLSGIKDRFLVNISHEIRTPLNAILGTTTLLRTRELTEDLGNHVGIIDDAGINLKNIIDDILSFKILTKEEMGVHPVEFNLEEAIGEVCQKFEKKAKDKKLFFDFYNLLDINETNYKGDVDKIAKSVNILLDNAVKYTDNGTIQVTLSTVASTATTDTIKFLVQDTGKGISKDLQRHIFEAFSQENETYSREFGGLGMGLAVFEKIMSKLNGEVIFESTIEEGSKFGFTLTLDKVHVTERTDTLNEQKVNKGKLNVLVVEDEEINQFIAKQLLEKVDRDLNIVIAQNGKIGVEKVMNEPIDFVFMDLQMPVMNGYEATEIIRNLESTEKQNIPIIALTAHTQNSERIKCKEYGMNDFLSKPYTIEDLANVIEAYAKK